MTLVLELPPDLQSRLTAEAAELGLPIAENALMLLSNGQGPQPLVQSGAELVAYWEAEGLVGTQSDIVNVPVYAEALCEKAQRRTR
jgi:hypothetical protein